MNVVSTSLVALMVIFPSRTATSSALGVPRLMEE